MREPRNDTKILNTALLSQGLLSMIVDAVPLAVNNKLERTVYNHNIARLWHENLYEEHCTMICGGR